MRRMKRVLWAVAFLGLAGFGAGSARAQDWTDYLHWPYTPPQYPGNGFQASPLYDGWYLYPREQRIVPQIQSKYYRNFYSGQRVLGHRRSATKYFDIFNTSRIVCRDWSEAKWYYGNHFLLDSF